MCWTSSRGEKRVRGGLDLQSDAAYHDTRCQSEFREDFSGFGEEKPRKGSDQGTGVTALYQGS